MGIDHGEAKVGIALGDESMFYAWPYRIIKEKTTKKVIDEIKSIIDMENVDKVVIGVPLSLNHNIEDNHFTMKDGKNKQMQKVLSFVKKLKDDLSIKIILEDERMTTKLANRIQKEFKRKEKQDDDISAMLILQGFLDRKKNEQL